MNVDLGRLAKAVHLDVEPLPDGEWLVAGTYRVDRTGGCCCSDATYRPGVTCKHVLATRLAPLGPEVLGALRLLVAPPRPAGAAK